MSKFKDTFRIESIRLKEWDYSIPWWYYVTINTQNHIQYFGNIADGNMVLNNLGLKAVQYWQDIQKHYINTELDYYVIMPNHIHGIIIIDHTLNTKHLDTTVEMQVKEETRHASSLRKNITLSDVVGSYKSAVTKYAHENGIINFKWQSRFYDRLIRNETELFNIRKYIEQNPFKWEIEKNDPENIDII